MKARRLSLLTLFALIMALVLAACGGQATPTGECLEPGEDGTLVSVPCETGDGTPVATPTPTQGNGGNGDHPGLAVFQRNGCGSCHTLEGVSNGQVGPDLSHIGSQGADYIHQSIVDPNAVIADNCPTGPCAPNIMPGTFGNTISQQDLDQLVEFLASHQ